MIRATPIIRRLGLTLVELMLALALAAIVLGSVLSLMQLLVVSDQRGLARFEQTTDLYIAQRSIGRSMQNLIGLGRAEERPSGPLPSHAIEQERQLEDALARAAEQVEGTSALESASRAAPPDERAFFEMFIEEYLPGIELPRLEIVTAMPPTNPASAPLLDEAYDAAYAEALGLTLEQAREMALQRRFTRVHRGAFEVRPIVSDDGQPIEWVFQYAPIDPPARPVVLVRDVKELFWQALPSASKGSEWSDVWVGWETIDFPIAVRIGMALGDGRTIDWVFETSVSVRTE